MNEYSKDHGIAMMCRVLGVTRGGFYKWLHKPLSAKATEEQLRLSLIRHSYIASSGVYGAQRVFLDLRETGEICGIHRVERVIRTKKYEGTLTESGC